MSTTTQDDVTGVPSWVLVPPHSPRCTNYRASLPAPLPPPPAPTAPPVAIANLVTPPTTANSSTSAPLPPTVTRPDLDNEIRVLLAKSSEKTQREQAERREVDAWVVAVVARLDEAERRRRLLDERTEALESRMTQAEHVNVEQARTTEALAFELHDRLTAVERRQARRRAFSWWSGPTEPSTRRAVSVSPPRSISPAIDPVIPD